MTNDASDTNGTADIGIVGLAVMGQNLAMNMADHGYTVAVHNRTTERMRDFVDGPAEGMSIVGHETIEDLVAGLSAPRKVMLMVRSGPVVDAVIEEIAPHLDAGDVLIDGGNSQYTDTIRRTRDLEDRGFRFVGTGVSGGEEGARRGPSIMPGGSPDAWPQVKDILQAVAAKVEDGTPCCDWVGSDGAGHYVKMVHNGIEYGDMQVIAEAYDLMKSMGLSNAEMSETFRSWSSGLLDSFLIDITADILAFTERGAFTEDGASADDGEATIDVILDAAGQKGTGKWTAISSLDAGQPLTLVAEAVYARVVSSFKEQRERAAGVLDGPSRSLAAGDVELDDIRDALYASKIVSYAQGFMLLRAASEEHEWDLDYGRIASLWREGCIIRAVFLDEITAAFARDGEIECLLLDEFFRDAVNEAQAGWRRVIGAATGAGVPVPAYSSALAFYDGYRSERLPANLIQAQRDYFGAHTYQRVDRSREEFFHTDWTGHGGATTSGSYNA
jgi:6-phosphogluconate dehydrogenase